MPVQAAGAGDRLGGGGRCRRRGGFGCRGCRLGPRGRRAPGSARGPGRPPRPRPRGGRRARGRPRPAPAARHRPTPGWRDQPADTIPAEATTPTPLPVLGAASARFDIRAPVPLGPVRFRSAGSSPPGDEPLLVAVGIQNVVAGSGDRSRDRGRSAEIRVGGALRARRGCPGACTPAGGCRGRRARCRGTRRPRAALGAPTSSSAASIGSAWAGKGLISRRARRRRRSPAPRGTPPARGSAPA